MDRDLFSEWSIVRFDREWERTGRGCFPSVRSALLQDICDSQCGMFVSRNNTLYYNSSLKKFCRIFVNEK